MRFPAGTYPSLSIRLKSNITLDLEPGATLLAAAPGQRGPPTMRPNPIPVRVTMRTSATRTGTTA